MDLRTTFAANVVRLRRAKGLSQEALAYEAGVNRSYCSLRSSTDDRGRARTEVVFFPESRESLNPKRLKPSFNCATELRDQALLHPKGLN